MKKTISLILSMLILFNLCFAVAAADTETDVETLAETIVEAEESAEADAAPDREAAKNEAKDKVEINSAGLITGNEDEYIKLLSELIDAPEPEECAALFEEAGTAGVHPRIIATKEDFANVLELTKTDEFISLLYTKQKEYTEELLTKPITDIKAQNSDKLAYAREVMDRMLLTGMMYQTTGDIRFYEYAEKQAELAMKESASWINDVLQTAEMVAGMAIAYDWFFDVLSPGFKLTLRNYLVTKMRAISINYSPVPQGFARQVNNWNAVCNGAYGMAALAIFDEEPDLSSMILSGAANSIALSIDQFGPDGAFPEGPGYWAYQVQYIVYFLSALDTAVKTDFGLADLEGIKNTGYYTIHMHGPTYSEFNYADAGPGLPQAQYLYWFAKEYGFDNMTTYAKTINPSGTNYSSWEYKSNDTFIMLWYQPSEAGPYDGMNEGGVYHGSNPAASLRTRWDDHYATYVAFKGGLGSLPHGNLDNGSFVIDALGKRWVDDLGREDDYWLPGYFDYYDGGRWTFFVTRAEGHNTLVFNPSKAPDQDPYAHCEITEFKSENGNGYGLVDLTPVYADHVDSAVRGIALCGDSVLVKDEVSLKSRTDTLWGINTKAAIELSEDKRTATLAIDDKRMQVSLLSPAGATFDVLAPESLSLKAVPGVKNLSAYKRLVTRGIYSGDVDITVQFTPFTDGESAPERFSSTYPLAQWKDGNIYESSGLVKSVTLSGVPMEDFTSSKLGYTISVDETEPIPVIEADYDKVNSHITIEQAEKIGDTARIVSVSRDPRIGTMEYTFKIQDKKLFGRPDNMNLISIAEATSSISGAELAIDGRMDTCLACDGTQWLKLDLGEKVPVKTVAIAFRSGLERVSYFDIEVSDDGENYTTVFSGGASGMSNDYENFKFSDVSARYVKVTCKGSSTGTWASINEILLYN